MSSEDTVIRFFAALEAGDIDTARSIYSPDALIWHNDYLQVRDGRIVRIEEYLDSAKRSSIRAAREAMSAGG